MALPIIEDLLKNDKTPVICGGTSYYIESLLWKILVDEPSEECGDVDDESREDLSNKELHDMLGKVDPARAEELHPNERRKILRSLQVYRRHKRPHSEILHEQRQGKIWGEPLRYSADRLAVIWATCDQEILDERCDKRVDKMMKGGDA